PARPADGARSPASRPLLPSFSRVADAGGIEREEADHRRAFVRRGLDAHRAAMQLDEALDNRQAETGAAAAAAIGTRLEATEHGVEDFGRHARPVIMDGEFDADLQPPAGKPDGGAVRRIVHRVAEQIVEDLPD